MASQNQKVIPIPNSRGDLFKRVHDIINDEGLDIPLNKKSPALERVVEMCLGHILDQEELNDEALKYVNNFCRQAPYHYEKSKSRINGMFSAKKSYFEALIPVEKMKEVVEPDPPPALDKVEVENDFISTVNDIVVEKDVTSATVEFVIPSIQKHVLANTPPVAAHVTVDVALDDSVDDTVDDNVDDNVDANVDDTMTVDDTIGDNIGDTIDDTVDDTIIVDNDVQTEK